MNRCLLDTHIILWWLSDDKKLDKKIRDIITDSRNNILVSSVSVWEIVIKKSLNKLTIPDNFIETLQANNFNFLPMLPSHALEVQRLPSIHTDPFDRLLIAQCIVEDLIFVTTDSIICKYKIDCFER